MTIKSFKEFQKDNKGKTLPPHIIALMKKVEKKEKEMKAKFKITDRTPKGFGPNG
jgi:hypothetical protein